MPAPPPRRSRAEPRRKRPSSSLLLLALLALEYGLSFLHEGLAALRVILALEALLDPGPAEGDVVIVLRHFADYALRRSHCEGSIGRDHVAVLPRRLLELGDGHYLVHQAHVQ